MIFYFYFFEGALKKESNYYIFFQRKNGRKEPLFFLGMEINLFILFFLERKRSSKGNQFFSLREKGTLKQNDFREEFFL